MRISNAFSLGLVLFFSVVGLPQTSSAQTEPDLQYYKEPGIYPTRSYLNQHFSEHIDPFTGRLQLHYVDLFIPGNGGFDLEITRSYTNVDDSITLETPVPFGLGWTVHFGRVLRQSNISLCDVDRAGGNQMPVLELPNGSRQILFRDDYSPFVGTAGFITTTRWRAECMPGLVTGLRVFAPNGTRYEMTERGNAPSGQNAWYTTKITDRNGNSVSISYTSLSGNVVPSSISTSDGRSVTFSYSGTDFNAHLTSISDGLRTWQYTYKQVVGVVGLWLLAEVVPPAGGSWKYAYKEAFDNIPGLYSIKTLTYPQGGTINYTYTSVIFNSGASTVVTNTAVSQKTASGGTWTFSYTPSTGFGINDKTTVNTPSGTITYEHIGYNTVGVGTKWQFGLLISKQIGTEQTETYAWTSQTISNQSNVRPGSTLAFDTTANAPVLSQRAIARNGNTYTTAYSVFDTFGNAQSVAESSTGFSRTTTLTYAINTSLWKIRQVKDETFDVGFSIGRTIDPNGNVTQETRFGVTTNYAYDPQGNLSTRTNARGKVATFSNYSRGIPQSETHPVSSMKGITTTRVVNPAGTVGSETDGKGDKISYTYDGLSRITGITYPRVGSANVVVSWAPASMTLTRGTFTQTTNYDGFGRISSTTKTAQFWPSQTATVTFRYDELGRRTFQSYPSSALGTTYFYDVLDRVKTVTHGDTTRRIYTYNPTSVTVNNERGVDQVASYRAFGDPDKRELIGISVPVLSSVNLSIVRNSIGQIRSVSQGIRTRTYEYYPATNFLRRINDPETGDTIFGRDEVGNMTSRQVALSPMTTYAYDDSDRLTGINYPSPTPAVTRTYYDDGMLQDVMNGIASRHFEYDPNKNLTLERLVIDGGSFEVRHTYGANDGRDTTSYPSGTVVNFASNGFGRPTQATPFLNGVDFHPTGEVKTIAYANGVTTSVTLTSSRLWPQRFTSLKSGTTTVADFQYSLYDGLGNVTKFEDFFEPANTIPSLGYDQVDRLLSWDDSSAPAVQRRFGYDGVGNLTSQSVGSSVMTYSYDASNRLNSISGTGGARSYPSFSYDVYGNVMNNGSQSFAYDDAGNMTCARCGQVDASGYLYDGLNIRVRAQKSGATTYFTYGLDGNLLSELTLGAGGGVDLRDYVYLAGRQVAVRASTQVPSTVTSSSGSISATAGSSVTLTVNVSGASPTGTVTFTLGSTVLGTANVVNGSASLTVSGLPVGNNTIVATYSGDANNTSGSTTLSVNVYDLSWLPAILQLLLDD